MKSGRRLFTCLPKRLPAIWIRCIVLAGLLGYGRSLAAQPPEQWIFPGGARSDTLFIDSLFWKGQALKSAQPDSAMRLLRQAWYLSNKAGYRYMQVLSLLSMAENEGLSGNPAGALALTRKAYTLCRLAGDDLLWGNYYLYGINLYNAIGYKDTAIQYAFQALALIDSRPAIDKEQVMTTDLYMRLASVYMSSRQEPLLAISYLEKALQVARSKGWQDRLPGLYATLGGAWANTNGGNEHHTNGYRKGLSWYYRAASASISQGDTQCLAAVYQNIAGIYCNLDKPDSARYYLDKMQALPARYISYEARIAAPLILALSYRRQAAYAPAIPYYLQAEGEAARYQKREGMLDIQEGLAAVYSETGQYREAFSHMMAYSALRDSMLDEEKIRITRQLELRYQAAQQHLRIVRQQAQIREQHTWIIGGALLSLSLVALLVVWRRNSRLRHKRQEARLRLMEQQQQLWKQGEEIRHLNAMVQGEERERARIGRELHDGVLSELVAVKLNLSVLHMKHPGPAEEQEEILAQVEDIMTDLRKTAHNLIPGILLEYGLVMALESYCEKTAGFTGLDITFLCQDYLPRMHVDFELSLYRMVQELVQNVMKHAQASSILVQIDYNEPVLILTVQDNGKGIQYGDQPAGGIGLANLRSRVAMLQGHIEIKGRENNGTEIYLEFDLTRIQSLIDQ